MPAIVILAELATIACFVIFCTMLAINGRRGPLFPVPSKDTVGRTLIRSTQAAFVLGYGAFFAVTAARALGAI